LCPYEGSDYSNFGRHLLTHTDERPYQCATCDMAFREWTALDKHKRTHTDEKPYKCDQCPVAFAQSHNLKRHRYFYHTEEGQKERKREEVKIANILPEGSFRREYNVDYKCVDPKLTFSRLDFFFPFWKKEGHVIIEVDENQHLYNSQSCETTRMNNVVTSWMIEGSDTPVVWIRYNPHGFKVNGVKKKMTQEERQKKLIDLLNAIEFENQPQVRVYYMFYDIDNGIPCVLSDPEYQETVKSWVVT